MKKKILSILFIFLVALLLVSCGDTGGKGEIIDFADQYGKKTVLRVWIDDENGEYMEAIIKEFNKLYPNIVVEHQHKGTVESREHLKTFGPSGNGTDVFQFPHDHLAQAISEDLVLPLPSSTQAIVNERSHELGTRIATLYYDEETGSFDPNSPNAVERLYAVPMSVEAVGLYYNKDLVETPVTTYEELFAEAAAWDETIQEGATLSNKDRGLRYLGTSSHWADNYFLQHIYSAFDNFTPFGPNLNDDSEVGYAKLENAVTWMLENLKPVTTNNTDDNSATGAAFEDGKLPYIIAGPWNIEGYKNKGVDFGVTKLPSINGIETRPYAGAMMAAVYKYSKNQEEAIKFVEFLNSDIAMQLQFEMKSKLPALKTELLGNIEGLSEDQALMAMSFELQNAVPMPTIPAVTYYWGPGEAMIKEVWNNGKNILDALAEAEAGYRTEMDLAD